MEKETKATNSLQGPQTAAKVPIGEIERRDKENFLFERDKFELSLEIEKIYNEYNAKFPYEEQKKMIEMILYLERNFRFFVTSEVKKKYIDL